MCWKGIKCTCNRKWSLHALELCYYVACHSLDTIESLCISFVTVSAICFLYMVVNLGLKGSNVGEFSWYVIWLLLMFSLLVI
jgi:hypothetical protein